jgi:dihydrodipicolinate synthase/N-acetylneuraminate lyase
MPALVTPFDEAGDIDLDAHLHNVSWMISRGIDGLLIGGSTGEGPYLEPGERHTLVAVAREEADDAFIICGVSGESLREAETLAAEAAEAGADALLVVTPTSLARGRDDSVRRYYEALADIAELPVMLYSVPKVTAYELPVDVVKLVAGRVDIVGMKDSGGQPVRAQQIVAAAPDDFYLFAGASAALSLSAAGGAYGAITASANYAPGLVGDVVSTARRNLVKASEAQEKLTGLSALVEARGVAGVKLAAEVAGMQPGHARAPVWPLEDDQAASLRRRLEAMKGQVLG